MGSIVEKIRDEVRHLPLGDRLKLVQELEDDLDSDEQNVRLEIDLAWEAQEQHRAEEIIKGEVKLMSSDDLTSRLNEVRTKYTA